MSALMKYSYTTGHVYENKKKKGNLLPYCQGSSLVFDFKGKVHDFKFQVKI